MSVNSGTLLVFCLDRDTSGTRPKNPGRLATMYWVYRDGGGGLALSVYIRKLSFSPSINGQMDSYLHHCDSTIKLQLVKNGFFLTMGKVSNKKKAFF